MIQVDLKNAQGKTQSWTMDLKAGPGGGVIKAGPSERKPDIVINTDDQLFLDLANGKTSGQKLFMAGKLKVKGQVMLAMKVWRDDLAEWTLR